MDDRRETLQARIRDAQLAKVPYMLVVGKREAAGSLVAVRERAAGDQGAVGTAEFIERLRREVDEKR